MSDINFLNNEQNSTNINQTENKLELNIKTLKKIIRNAVIANLFIAIINTLVGSVLCLGIFLKYLEDLGINPTMGIFFVFMGIFYFGMTIGAVYQSRTTLLLGSVILILDSILTLLYSFHIVTVIISVVRIFLIYLMIRGSISAFLYHQLKTANKNDVDQNIQNLFQKTKLSMVHFIVFGIVMAVGISCAGWAICSISFSYLIPLMDKAVESDELSNRDNKDILATLRRYNMEEIGVSMLMPKYVELDQGDITEGIYFTEAYADTGYLGANIVVYHDIFKGMPIEEMEEYKLELAYYLCEDDSVTEEDGQGELFGQTYRQLKVENSDGTVELYRVINIGENGCIFIARGVGSVNDEKLLNLLESILNSAQISSGAQMI